MKQSATTVDKPKDQQLPTKLVDRFGREVNYVRLSVTDRCDLRCVYCMSEDMKFVPREQLLTLEEMSRIGTAFVELGVNKIRISGGEPLTRRNILSVFETLGKLDGLTDLTLTTNATLLKKYAQPLKDAGVTRINISLDTIQPERFAKITRIGKLQKTMDGIDEALKVGFDNIKINTVVMKNFNHDEVIDLVEFIRDRGMDISFIEEMPLGDMGDHDRSQTYCSSDDILKDLRETYNLVGTDESTGGPAKYFRFMDSEGNRENESRIGFISPHSHNFCDTCNRVRVTAEGMLLLCLGQEHSMDLRQIVRAHPTDDAALRKALIDSMQIKPKGHDFNVNEQPIIMRHMSATGG
jgi:cyclic pyranopterin phosphate synthase